MEKLTARCEEEAWKEVAEMCDQSMTFQSASFRCKAVRKFAAFHNRPLESVTAEEVEKSPQGLRAWGEMAVVVPGLVESATPATPSGSSTGTATPVPTGGAPNPPISETEGEKPKGRRGRGKTKTNNDGTEEPAPKKKKAKKELTGEQQQEKDAKEILAQYQWSSQIMEKAATQGDSLPSEWKWAKPFLEEYRDFCAKFKLALVSEDGSGENIVDFVDELKLCIINKSTRSLKKSYGNRYESLLALFVDRCKATTAQTLGSCVRCFLTSKDEQHRQPGSQDGLGYVR